MSEHPAHYFLLSARDLERLRTMMLKNGRWDGLQGKLSAQFRYLSLR